MSKSNIIGLLMVGLFFLALWFVPLILEFGIRKVVIGHIIGMALVAWLILGCFLFFKKTCKDKR